MQKGQFKKTIPGEQSTLPQGSNFTLKFTHAEKTGVDFTSFGQIGNLIFKI
jgi:hypothetical protein